MSDGVQPLRRAPIEELVEPQPPHGASIGVGHDPAFGATHTDRGRRELEDDTSVSTLNVLRMVLDHDVAESARARDPELVGLGLRTDTSTGREWNYGHAPSLHDTNGA